jgi:hypothetical protein
VTDRPRRVAALAAALAFALAGLLAACADSPPTRFFQLEPTPAEGPRLDLPGPPIGVAAVRLPPELERRALVLEGPGAELQVRGTERWAGPLDLMVRRTLALNLARRLAEGDVVVPGQPKPEGGSHGTVVTIERFAAGPEGTVVLAADWSLVAPDGRTLLRQSERVTARAASPEGAAVSAAMSRALGRLADAMARDLADGLQP